MGKVKVGGDAPISVQTMTNTLTTDVAATIEQIQRCAIAGADIVRVLLNLSPAMPVAVVSGVVTEQMRTLALEAGARLVMAKSGQVDQLLAAAPNFGRNATGTADLAL